jgi:calcineurin-like phosphoesterase family protein
MDASKIWFTSDTHFGHKGVIDLCGRPWETTDEMDEGMIERWNEEVPRNGTVFHLGDVSFCRQARTLEILNRLNGTIYLVEGNHDNLNVECRKRFQLVRPYYEIKVGKHKVVMCHYPILSWNRMAHGAFHLHGHSHGNMKPSLHRRMDVGVDCWDYRPIPFEMIEMMFAPREPAIVDHHKPRTTP